jgi:hypothetical protein
LTAPDQSVRGIPESPTADGSGSISGANIRIAIDTTFRVGTWFITAQGRSSGRQAIGTFRVESEHRRRQRSDRAILRVLASSSTTNCA